MKKYLLGIVALVFAALFSLTNVTYADPGEQVTPPGPILPDNGCGDNNGVGVAFDGNNILFTCTNEAAVRMTDVNGTDLGSLATVDAANNPVALDAIAWDNNEEVLWGGNTDPANDLCHIYSVDMTTGVATERFSFSDPVLDRCGETFFDGVTVDHASDTLWLSPDIHTTISHYQKDGTELVGDAIDFTSLTSGECPWAQGFGSAGCWNSGLAMGLDGNLFAGTASDGKIYQLDPSAGGSVLGEFATVTGRDEDLECGPLVNGFESILSRDFETGRIDILEAPDGTCVTTEITLDPPNAVNELTEDDTHSVTATVTANGQPLVGVQVDFSIASGPNMGEVSDDGECSTNTDCTTDAAGQTSWTYTSNGLGTDVIVACYVTQGGTEHCVRAAKDWVDTTPPEVSCTETTNPHGKKTPPAGSTTLPGPRGGQNEDGFYLLGASDNLDTELEIFVNGFGAYKDGDKVKVTESPGAAPTEKKMGSSNGQADAIAAHLILDTDAEVTVVDSSGNETTVSCLVPPQPK